MISFAILARFYRPPLSGQYLNGGDASSLAQFRTHRKRARSAAKHETGFAVRLAWQRKTDRGDGVLRADRVETLPQSLTVALLLVVFPFGSKEFELREKIWLPAPRMRVDTTRQSLREARGTNRGTARTSSLERARPNSSATLAGSWRDKS